MPLCVGWKSICKLLDCKDAKTARKWVKQYHLPLVWLGGRPTTSVAQFDDWWGRVQKKARSQKKQRKIPIIWAKENPNLAPFSPIYVFYFELVFGYII